MAKLELRNQALEMREKGMSYSQIRENLAVSKSTLSLWLREHPLSRERINELRGNSEQRIERCRNTKRRNRQLRLDKVFDSSSKRIKTLNEREFYVAGLLLYWAEGTKAARGSVCMTNTDPAMLSFFISWLVSIGVDRSRIRGYLHLYEDMDIAYETRYWAEILCLPESSFRKPYIKASEQSKRKNYKGRFGHGTCNVYVHDIKIYEEVMAGVQHLRSLYGPTGIPPLAAV